MGDDNKERFKSETHEAWLHKMKLITEDCKKNSYAQHVILADDIERLVEQAERVEGLELTNERLRKQHRYQLHEKQHFQIMCTKLREALEFYANESTWQNGIHQTVEGDTYEDAPPFIYDTGQIARQVLGEAEGHGKAD